MKRPSATHDVTNQPPPFADINLFASDKALADAVAREGAPHAAKELNAFGLLCGSAEAFERGRLANAHPPELVTHDAFGQRADTVIYHPAYHECMELSTAEGLHSNAWVHLAGPQADRPRGVQVARAAGFYMAAQMETGHCCPITMTNACVPALLSEPEIAKRWLPRITARSYDPKLALGHEKRSATIGMGMTEKQGGTDVKANTTMAEAIGSGGPGTLYRLTGHKWFVSAPMSDAFLILAQAPGGLSCFMLPRVLPDDTMNAVNFMRLKNKLGNRSNASAEAEFDGAHAWLIGAEGGGLNVIMEMVTHTRLDCAVASAGLMRLALAHAIHHAEHRYAFSVPLADQPLMRQVLADMALDVEAAVALSFRLARAFDRVQDPRAAAWARLMTPVTKYAVCKMAPGLVAEAMECLGGNGYTEALPLARIYREVPVNSIWEGSGNVMALDVLRVLQHDAEAAGIVFDDLEAAAGDDTELRAAHARVEAILQEPRHLDVRARGLLEGLATLAAGTILRAHAPAATADAYIATRIAHGPRLTYGHGLEWADTAAIIERASPNR